MSLRLYRALLVLYPPSFYQNHADEMTLDFADLAAQHRDHRLSFTWRITRDLVQSLFQENLRMLFDAGLRRVFFLQAVLLTTLVSALALMTYVVGQQVMRHDANDPQIQIASDAAAEISGGATAQSVVPAHTVDVAQSLAPFVIVYDDSGTPIASSGNLHGKAPRPPVGVFNSVRDGHRAVLTWRPEPGVRIASVTYRYSGTQSGFVLAGRSLREVETRTDTLFKLVALGWAVLMGVLLVGTVVLLRACPAPLTAA